MESKGKMLLSLSTIALLAGFSAVGYVAIQKNANVTSHAVGAPPAGIPPDAAGSAAMGRPTCTTAQDCIDFAVSKGACKAGAACPPNGGSLDCVGGSCTYSASSGQPLNSAGSDTNTGNPSISTTPSCSTKSSGDFDCNGKIDCADLTLFVREFSGAALTKISDINTDGRVSLIDFEMGRVGSNGAWGGCQL